MYKRQIPAVIQYLGKVLTPAVIGMLVVYCLKATPVLDAPHGLPEAIAVAVTCLLYTSRLIYMVTCKNKYLAPIAKDFIDYVKSRHGLKK